MVLVAVGAGMAFIATPTATPQPIQVVAAPVAKPVPHVAPAAPAVKNVAYVKPQRIPPITGAAGLTANAAALAHYIQTTYPNVASIGGVRSDPLPDHPSGHAVDVMVFGNTALGNTIAADILNKAARFHVRYAIWEETYRTPSGIRRWMADRGSVTANHYDHVHLTVF